jgi:putative nucleotidyltransferase with HDIG domain
MSKTPPAPRRNAPVDTWVPPDTSPFAPFARELGVTVPVEPAFDEEAEVALEAACAQVLRHWRGNKLGPASAPTLSLRILNLVATPNSEMSELSRIISADPALSAGVLHVANSAASRGVEEVRTVREAVTRLGLEEVGRVAGALSAKSLFNPRMRQEQAAYGPLFSSLYQRAISIATVAGSLAMQRQMRSDTAYLGGMLHDVGKTVALRAVAGLALEGTHKLDVEHPLLERILDRVHVEIGSEVHQEWQLPQYLTVLAVRHHDPVIPDDRDFHDLHIVRLVAALADLRTQPRLAWRCSQEIVQSATALKLDPHGVRALSRELKQADDHVTNHFGLGNSQPPPPRNA